jgi:rSAM/selenodomain-associated transferase 2
MGPAADGGYYLIGLSHPEPALFESIPWGTAEVARVTRRRAARLKLDVRALEPLADVDRSEDLPRLPESLLGGGSFPPRGPGGEALVSVVVPALNEGKVIGPLVARVVSLPDTEVVVADGGSADDTAYAARRAGARVVAAPPGRGPQMNAGAASAAGEVLLFAHADSRIDAAHVIAARDVLAERGTAGGAFPFRVEADEAGFRTLEKLVGLRNRLLGVVYGDQGLFVRAKDFRRVGGFPDWPLFEDAGITRRLRRLGRFVVGGPPLATSARRWRSEGLARTTLLNQLLGVGYALGVPPTRLARLRRSVR